MYLADVLDNKSQALIAELAGDQLNVSNQSSRTYEALEYLMSVSERSILNRSSRTAGPMDLHVPHELFQLASIYMSLLEILSPSTGNGANNEILFKNAVARLDRAIILTGGDRFADLLEDVIKGIQDSYLPLESVPVSSTMALMQRSEPSMSPSSVTSVLASNPVPSIPAPSLSSFQREHSRHPFVIKSYAYDWPALNDHPWSSLEYLRQVGGRGRVVPVEVGSDYRTSGWTQELMDWEEFLTSVSKPADASRPKLYLAQHSLLRQFPALRSDMEIPLYVYSAPEPPDDWGSYKPPMNDEKLVINAWLGPQYTMSPAHFDPYFNCFVQVVGRKTVWIAPPSVSDSMYASGENIGNTSQVDVFAEDTARVAQQWPEFAKRVIPQAMSFLLEPGDMLFLPPGWWHAMRSEELSFSVSFWF
ncbi:hypothetical protein M407DRAFT_213498 [Tulasnella calospora MUT 4182]|uniref:JmjC domain-containing protein n=1 Tax=Tulasnella calospora MUT 4182 TaxID=1051891 RepID=A0A0C3QV53_9AGAM|nr:hypothetical protein M407DRAFT_213498 [Tulasnella calospora MUT 4182]